jgi:hypothetical protein
VQQHFSYDLRQTLAQASRQCLCSSCPYHTDLEDRLALAEAARNEAEQQLRSHAADGSPEGGANQSQGDAMLRVRATDLTCSVVCMPSHALVLLHVRVAGA